MTWNSGCLNNVAVLRLCGEIDQWEVPAIRARLEESLCAAGWRALVDLSAVPWLSSMMIGLLIATHRLAVASGGAIVFAGLAPTVRRSLAMLGADQLLCSAPTVPEGLAALACAGSSMSGEAGSSVVLGSRGQDARDGR
jgi:anti-anti-sigma factor